MTTTLERVNLVHPPLLSPFEEQICSLMPKHEADAYRAELTTKREQAVKARDMVRNECAEAVELLAGAIRSPDVARSALERALTHFHRALSAAAVLDPEDA